MAKRLGIGPQIRGVITEEADAYLVCCGRRVVRLLSEQGKARARLTCLDEIIVCVAAEVSVGEEGDDRVDRRHVQYSNAVCLGPARMSETCTIE